MSSANNTLEAEDGNSIVEQESVPSALVLDKSRSLFGNSSYSTSARDPTPDSREEEPAAAVAETSVTMETDEVPVVEVTEPAKPDSPEPQQQQPDEPEEPMDTTEPVAEPAAPEETPESPEAAETSEAVEEEVFEKKVVSMDTDGDAEKNGDDNEKDDEMEDEEEEIPVKKPKRAAPVSEDEMDDTQDDEESEEPEEAEEKQEGEEEEKIDEQEAEEAAEEVEPVAQEQAEPVEAVEEPTASDSQPNVPSDDSASLQIDESAEKAIEAEANGEGGEEEPTSSRRSARGRKSAAATTPSTPTPRRGRGRAANQTEADESVETPSRRGRSARNAKPVEEEEGDAPAEEDADDTAEGVADEAEAAEEVEVTPKKGRGRRSAAAAVVADEAPAEEAPEGEAQEGGSQRRSVRARRSAAAAPPPATPKSTRRGGRKSNVEPEPDAGEQEEVEEEEAAGEGEEETSPTKRTRTPRGRKAAAKVEEVEEKEEGEEQPEEPEAPSSSSRRSARTKPTPKAEPATPSKRTPARGGRKKQVANLDEEGNETEEVVETPAKKGRQSAKATPAAKKKDEYDPYDLDTEIEHHPEPLKNIQMEVQNFGAVKYAKAGASEAKYSITERTAESRIHEIQTSSGSKNRRSLADMTPGKEKLKHKMTYSAPSGRKSRAQKVEEPEDVEMEEDEQPTSSAAASTPSGRGGKKRKSQANETAAVPPAKKQPEIKIRTLNDEEQLQVDHPNDDNEPYAPGARVYANFNKIFYPAIIVTERDGLGRYKLKFTDDGVVKDVPNAGIVPLRAVDQGKSAFYDGDDVLIDSPPDDISAATWLQGKVIIRMKDDDGEPTEETKVVEWNNLSFDHTDWRDYLKSKEQAATAIVTSNITTMSEASRARKQTVKAPPKTRKPARTDDISSSRGNSTPRTPDDDDEILQMNEKAVGKNIFAGKLFMLTSANRSHSQTGQVQAMLKKKNLTEFIRQNGGIVTESFTDSDDDKDRLLISDTFYRTHKYLAALASSIPCVSNIWVQKCAEKGELVDYKDYILPAGSSIFDGVDMPAPEHPPTLLAGKTIYVHSTHAAREVTQNGPGGTFIDIWSSMLEKLGATILKNDWRTLEEENVQFDMTLVDGTFRDEVLEYADKIGAAKVTSEWVIQTIILNGAPDPTSHSKFDPLRLRHRPQSSP